jgi:hypothetical protein
MHADRLLKLAELLERDAKNPTGLMFDLGTWAAPSEQFQNGRSIYFAADALGIEYGGVFAQDVPVADEKLPKITCGTTACALGLAMLSGEFAQWGLGGSADIDGRRVSLEPNCNGESGFDAGAELFDISENDSLYLFDPQSYGDDTPREAAGELLVAQRIRDFVRGDIDVRHHPDTRDGYNNDED